MIGTRINERYRIDSELGQGGMGTVYKGFDNALEREVAVKMMTEARLGTEGRSRLMEEARAIAKLSHPNVVTVFDTGEYEKNPYIVMEYVEGVNLYDQPPKEIEDIVAVIRQVCTALAHAHQHGIIHRDLKPENVILSANGTVKLMDFGLARSISSRLTSEGTILGTVFYLAPEQAQGQPIDPRSDLYSLGVMLYELTTGGLPFMAGDPLAVVSQHIHAPVVPPRAKNDRIPPALEALILQLMQKDPLERPTSAKEVLERLSAPEMLDATAMPLEELSVLDRIVRGRLVGRERELKQARQAWLQAMSGQGQLLLVSGEPGVGKTRLMREIATQAEVSGGQAFIGESQAEGNAPYAAFAQIFRRALRAHQDKNFELSNLVLAELISIAPNLQFDYPDIPPNPALGPESEQLRLFESVIRFLSTICEKGPLLLVFEDIHWADSGTLSLLQFLAKRCREYPVLLLGTYREVELDEALPFHQTLLDLNRKNLGTRLKLERLDEEKTREMLEVIFNTEEIIPEFLAGIYQETEGNPFYIEEVCKALIESGQVYFDGEHWQQSPEMVHMEIPQSIKVAIQSRVSKLDESAQEVLLTAAVIGREFGFELLHKVTEKEEDDLIVSLESALKAQLIEELREVGGEQFYFSHALIPATLRESLSGMRRTRLHRKVAQTMEEVMPDAYQRLAYHWGESGNEDKGLEYIIKAAERAKQTYANEDAIRLYSEALVFLDDDDERRFDLLLSKVDLYNLIGDRDSQRVEIEAMLALAEKQKDEFKQVDALHALVELYLQIDLAKARESAERAHNIAKGLDDDSRIARSSYLIGRFYAMRFDQNSALPHMQKAVELARSLDSKDELLVYLGELARVYGNQRNAEAAMEVGQEAVALSKQVKNKRLELIATKSLVGAHYWQKNYETALPISQTALQLAREIGDIDSELDVLNGYGLNLAGLKRWKEAEAVYLKMIEGFDLFVFHTVLKALNNIIVTQVELGEYEKYHFLIRNLMEKAKQTGNQHMHFQLADFYSNSCFRLGKYQEYQKMVEDIWSYVDALDDQAAKINTLFYLGVSSGLVGEFNSAYEYMDKSKLYLEDLENFYHEVNFWIGSAFIALLDGKISALELGLEQINRGITLWQQNSDEITWFAYYVLAGLHLALAKEDSEHLTEALSAIELAFKSREEYSATDPLEQLFSMAWRVYRANNQPEKADEYLRKGYERVMMVAGKIQNDELRMSFLENVPYNREILEEAKARGWVTE